MTVQTSAAAEFLATLVQCERYPSRDGMPVSGCLRRQLERQRGAKKGTLGPAAKPFCALGCAQGRELATIAASVGVQATTCPTCGAALVGGVACEVCMDTKAPAKGFLPAGVERSERIWAPDAPDAPLGPPPSPVVGVGAAGAKCIIPGCTVRLKKAHSSGICATCRANGERATGTLGTGPEAAAAAAERVREAAPRVAPASADPPNHHDVAIPGPKSNQEPAGPAEEETMRAARKPEECCGSLGPRCLSGCKGAGKPALPPRPAKAPKVGRRTVRLVESAGFDVKGATVEQLVATIEACRLELVDRRAALQAQLDAVADAIGTKAA